MREQRNYDRYPTQDRATFRAGLYPSPEGFYDKEGFLDERPFESSRMGGREDYRGHGPKGWKRSDEGIKDDVCSRLASDPYVDASEIEVEVADGVASITGGVENRQMKRRAEYILDDIGGLRDVQNGLTLKSHHLRQKGGENG